MKLKNNNLKYLISIFFLQYFLFGSTNHQINGIVIDSKTLVGIPDVNLYIPTLKY